MSATPSESALGYSDEEIAEMKAIFAKYDFDGNGHLSAHEFTNALQLMDYKYNEEFVVAILKLVFDAEWQSKQNHLVFDDFLDFMSEFEPVHYEVLDKIAAKLSAKHIESNDQRIANLLQYVHFKNGSLALDEVDDHLDSVQHTANDDNHAHTLSLKSPFQKPAPLSPSLPPITETVDANVDSVNNTENEHARLRQQYEQPIDGDDDDANIAAISNDAVTRNLLLQHLNDEQASQHTLLSMQNQDVIEWLNADKAFNSSKLRNDCCEIIQQQSWNGAEMVQALQSNNLQEILALFRSLQNYQYLVHAVNEYKPNDVDYRQLMAHFDAISKQSFLQQQTENNNKSIQRPAPLQNLRTPSTADAQTFERKAPTNLDADDEAYTQKVWREILQFFDEDNDGTISMEEMAPAMRALGIDVCDEKLNEMIRRLDQNKSGSIDYAEFKQYYQTLFQQEMQKGLDWKFVQQTFEKYDVDGSGTLHYAEFSYALKQICPNITDEDVVHITQLIDTTQDGLIDFEEFVQFLESAHPKAEWVLRKLIRSSMPSPMQHLMAFKGLPQHFRKSELAELSKHNSFKISEFIKPKIDEDGVTLRDIQIDPQTLELRRKHSSGPNPVQMMLMTGDENKNSNNSNGQNDGVQSVQDRKQADLEHFQNIRVFKITECSGVALPEPLVASRIVSRSIRVCVYCNNQPISNVYTIPAAWKSTEQDQWKCGANIWKESVSSTLAEWNVFCVAVQPPNNNAFKLELRLELCVTVKSETTSVAAVPLPPNSGHLSPPRSPLAAAAAASSPRLGSQQHAARPMSSGTTMNMVSAQPTFTEMSCGWAKVEIVATNLAMSSGINRQHKLKIHGGTFGSESDIKSADIRNDRSSSLSLRKLKQQISGFECMVKVQEQSYLNLSNEMQQNLKWIPHNVLTAVSSARVFRLYSELVADRWLRNQQIFEFQFWKQDVCQTLLLHIVDRPNLLCVLVDEWKLRWSTFWRSQKKDRKFVCAEFASLLQQFVPCLSHHQLVQDDAGKGGEVVHVVSLDQQRLTFVRQMVQANVKQILYGNQQSGSIPLLYAPFTTHLLAH